MTECNGERMHFQGLGRRRVEADFSGGQLSSDGGVLLLREVDQRMGLSEGMAECFTDYRRPELIEHSVAQLLAQRTYALVQGYEDLSDHAQLTRDPLMATAISKPDPEGTKRGSKDRGQGMASPSTLGRVERTPEHADRGSRYAKVVADFDKLREFFVQRFIERFHRAPPRLILDLDPSDVPLHGEQQQRFFHGYYREHCYLPMYLFCGQFPLAVVLRPSNIDGSLGAVELLAPVIDQIRAAFPEVHLIVRADSGFCRDELMSWCESQSVDYVFGMARNPRLERAIATQLEQARRQYLRTGQPARVFRHFFYRTLSSWSGKRRVIGKAEYLPKGANPRFVVTSLSAAQFEKRYLYEEMYCARGEMENRIKEQQLDLFGNRASCHKFRGNHVRLWLSMAAHWLVVCLRQDALQGTELATAQAGTLRTKLLKIGALVTVSVRRVYVRLSSAFPLKQLFVSALARLRPAPS